VAASEAQQKLQELYSTINGDLEKTRRELSEMETLLRQTTTEVEKLAQRELTVANRLRDLEVNLDKYSKADIKNFYTSAQEVQMRLLMMRGQLEQLQFRQQALKNRQSQAARARPTTAPIELRRSSRPRRTSVCGFRCKCTTARLSR
jgi:two-component system sensor histidine kinase DegS